MSIPEYEISIKDMRQEIQSLKAMGFEVMLPVKSLPIAKVLTALQKELAGFEVSNLKELCQLPKHGTHLICHSSPLDSDIHEIQRSKNSRDIVFSLQSLLQYKKYAGQTRHLLRLNPYSFYDRDLAQRSRFGISLDQLKTLPLHQLERENCLGFATHFGWFLEDVNLITRFLAKLRQWCQKKDLNPGCINLGGGTSRLSRKDLEFIAKSAQKLFPGASIWLEPGARVSQSGISVKDKIIGSHEVGNSIFCQLNLSFEAHLRWTDPLVKADFLKSQIPAKTLAKKNIWFVGGTCSESDRLGPFHVSKSTKAKNLLGENVHFVNVNGYALAWNTEFNGRPPLKMKVKS